MTDDSDNINVLIRKIIFFLLSHRPNPNINYFLQ